jgi:hypothetical protein
LLNNKIIDQTNLDIISFISEFLSRDKDEIIIVNTNDLIYVLHSIKNALKHLIYRNDPGVQAVKITISGMPDITIIFGL